MPSYLNMFYNGMFQYILLSIFFYVNWSLSSKFNHYVSIKIFQKCLHIEMKSLANTCPLKISI